MKNFMEHDFVIANILLCCFLPMGKGDPVHKNRASHGVALHIGGEKIYTFDDGKVFTVRKPRCCLATIIRIREIFPAMAEDLTGVTNIS